MMKYFFLGSIFIAAVIFWWTLEEPELPLPLGNDDEVACTADAMQCPDGSFVGRQGPNCEFAECPESTIPADIQAHIDAKADLIQLSSPQPGASVSSPLNISGQARGYWFFEASFPFVVTDWNGQIIGNGYVTADDEWMIEEFVPFSGVVQFELPADAYSNTGTLILQRSNASGLPENDDALEIPLVLQ